MERHRPRLRRVLRAGLAALACALAAPAGAAACANAELIPTAANAPAVRSAVGCLLNQQRIAHGQPPLAFHPALTLAAQRHSDDMVRRRYFSHTTLGGPSVIRRLLGTSYDIPGRRYDFGEALGYNYGTAATPGRMTRQILASAQHRAYLLAPRFRHLGVGVAAEAPRPVPGYTGATYTLDVGLRG
jgi:uncharacterized protein YkwD